MAAAAAGFWQVRVTEPIGFVRIFGPLRHVQAEDLRRVVTPLLGSYWGIDLAAVVGAVERLAWVDRVRAERVWPDVLVLNIREQQPLLRWNRNALLNRRGEKFMPSDLSAYADLPRLSGPGGYEGRLFRAYRRMAAALQPLGRRIVHLEVDRRRSWRLRLDSGTRIVLGRLQPEETFDRVVAAMKRLGAERCRRIDYLDARYEHGFAIRWRPDQETMKKQPHG